jgi:hypothetical protein
MGVGDPLVNGDFESGPTAWTQFSTHGWPLILSSADLPVSPHGGNWAVWLGGDFDETAYIEQQVTVPSGAPYLRYWHWISSEDDCGWDFAWVIVDSTTADAYNLCASANTGGWVEHSVDLSAFAGQTVDLQIRADNDSSLLSNLFVDDVSFQSSLSAGDPGQ